MVNMGGTAALVGLLMFGAAMTGCFLSAYLAYEARDGRFPVLIGTSAGFAFIVVSTFLIAAMVGS